MSTAPLWLSLDQGGHASRALVFDAHGQVVTQAFAAINTHTEGERVTHDADDIVQSLRACLHQVAQSLGQRCRHIQAAGLATQRSSIVCWRRDTGAALSPVLSWQDRRGATWLQTFAPQQAHIQTLTGLVLSPHYGASKLRWCLDHLDKVQRAQHEQQLCLGPLSSFLLHRLLAEQPLCVDPANASRTQLWSPINGDWHEELLTLFGVPRELLPSCVPSRHAYGSLQLGDHTVPLTVCTGDQAAVPFASGALAHDCIYLNLGTGAFALAPLNHDIPNAAPLLRSVLWSDAQHTTFALEGTVNGAGAALIWLGEHTGIDITRIDRSLTRDSVTALNVPLFLNGVGGIGSPYWLTHVAPQFIPMQALDDRAPEPLVAAVLESIAFLLAANVALLRRHLPGLTHIRAGGGLSACSYLCECLADLSELPVLRLAEPELTAKGLAYLVADHPQQWPVDAGRSTCLPHANPALQSRQQRFTAQLSAWT